MKLNGKCSALLAASAGMAVSFSGNPALAVSGTDGNDIGPASSVYELNSNVRFHYSHTGRLSCVGANSTSIGVGTSNIATYGAGLDCNVGNFDTHGQVNFIGGPKYIKILFNNGTPQCAWSEITQNGSTLEFGAWCYAPTGSGLKTLSSSVTAKKLGCADGIAKLLWSNTNEDGIARYEAQTKDASGAWTTVSSDAAGAGSYSATVPADVECRVVVEKVDGATEEIGF